MYHATDASFVQTVAIKEGRYSLSQAEQIFVGDLSKKSGVQILNFYLYTTETDAHYRQQHIVFIVGTSDEKAKMEELVSRVDIKSLVQTYLDASGTQSRDKLKKDFYPRIEGVYPDLVQGVCALENVLLKTAYAKASKQIVALAERYPDVWLVSANGEWHTVFYYTEAQRKAASLNGVEKEIRADILALLKAYDPYNYFNDHSLSYVQFDSREILDANFEGNLYYYYK